MLLLIKTPLQILTQSFRIRFPNPGVAGCNPQVSFLMSQNPISASRDVVYSHISFPLQQRFAPVRIPGTIKAPKVLPVGLVCGMCWVWSCTKHWSGSGQPFLAARLIWGQTCWSWIVTWQKMSKWLCPMMRTWRDQQESMSTYLTSNTRWVEEKMGWGVLENAFVGWAGGSVCAWCPKPKGRIHLNRKPKQKNPPLN